MELRLRVACVEKRQSQTNTDDQNEPFRLLTVQSAIRRCKYQEIIERSNAQAVSFTIGIKGIVKNRQQTRLASAYHVNGIKIANISRVLRSNPRAFGSQQENTGIGFFDPDVE